MTTIYLEKNDIPQVILNVTGYTGRKFQVHLCDKVTLSGAYWSEGSRSTYTAINLATGVAKPAHSGISNPFQCPQAPTVNIPPQCVVVEHVIFRGRDMGLTIHARRETVTPLLPVSEDLTEDEYRVIEATCAYKSSYGGVKNYRQVQSGLSPDRWEAAKKSLIMSGHLRKNGAVTPKGRNARKGR